MAITFSMQCTYGTLSVETGAWVRCTEWSDLDGAKTNVSHCFHHSDQIRRLSSDGVTGKDLIVDFKDIMVFEAVQIRRYVSEHGVPIEISSDGPEAYTYALTISRIAELSNERHDAWSAICSYRTLTRIVNEVTDYRRSLRDKMLSKNTWTWNTRRLARRDYPAINRFRDEVLRKYGTTL